MNQGSPYEPDHKNVLLTVTVGLVRVGSDDPQESPQAALDIYHNIAGNELKDRRGEFAMNSVNLNHDMEVLALKLVGIYEFEEEGDSNAIHKEFEAAISI